MVSDGRVFVAGGKRAKGPNGMPFNGPTDPRLSGEIFSPPYLTQAVYPQPIVDLGEIGLINFDPTEEFTIKVTRDEDLTIDAVVLLRPGATTHHFDNDQRYIELFFELESSTSPVGGLVEDTIKITSPDKELGPPGYYMLFAVGNDGSSPASPPELGHRIPSRGKFLRIQ